MKEEAAIKVLHQAKAALDEEDVEFWLDFGTLLGAVRDGKFIAWENDIDFGTWRASASKVFSAFRKLCENEKGFIKVCDENQCIKFITENGCRLDVTLYRLEGSSAVRKFFPMKQTNTGLLLSHLRDVLAIPPHIKLNPEELRAPFVTQNLFKITRPLPSSWRRQLAKIVTKVYKKVGCNCVQVAVPSHYFMNLSSINFYGAEFKVPAETVEYLAYKYGEDWRVPRRDWVYYEDDRSIVEKINKET